jgi:hypothetical protein
MKEVRLCKRIATKVVLLVLIISAPVVAEDKADARAILERMSAEIAGLEKFVITGDAYVDARLPAGQLIEHSSDVVLRVSKPDALRMTNRSIETRGEIFFADGVLSVYNEKDNYYAQTPLPAGLDAAVRFAVDEVGIEAPVLDFITSDGAAILLEDAESVEYFGLSRFRGQNHHHIGIRTPEIDVQVWVLADGAPLPAKMAISAKWDGGSPRSVFFFSWDTNPRIKSKTMRFEPPPGAIKIEFDRGAEQ